VTRLSRSGRAVAARVPMRPARRTLLSLAALAALAALPALAGPAAAAGYDDYHDVSEVEAQLRVWASNPAVDLQEIGRSAGGRALWVVRIAAAGETAPDERPAVFVGANIAGYHNAGTEAALDLIETLLSDEHAGDRETRTFYVAPVLNPDAHDALFATPRVKRSGDGMKLDRDRDGFEAEDGFDDLDGDGRITRMRIADPTGGWVAHATDPRVMVKADSMKERVGAYRMLSEGRDDDGDGDYNEDPAGGVAPDRNFAHQFPYPRPDAGPWPSYAPESKAIMDFLLAHRNVALAFVYGPANNLLAKPQSLGGGGDLGTQKFTLPQEAAEFLGLDHEQEYTLDEVWDVAKDMTFVIQNNITKEQLGQFLGAGPATKVADEDMAVIDHMAKAYTKRLEDAGLSKDRPAEQYQGGGFTPWLYYQYGVMAVELDVWGVPKAEKKAEEGEGEPADAPLTLERLKEMSSEDVIALGAEKIQTFLDDNHVPSQFDAARVISALESGQVTPDKMAGMMEQMGAGGGGGDGEGDDGEGDDGDDSDTQRAREVLAWVEENAPDAISPWTEVTLPDGTKAEVGGLDPFVETTPPMAILRPAIDVHTETILDAAGELADMEMVEVEAVPVGAGVVRVKAVARNRGFLPTHTSMARRAQTHVPVRLELQTGNGVELLTGYPFTTAERLEGSTGTVEGTWLVRAAPGTEITVRVRTDNAGRDQMTTTVRKGA
jgi:Zinc carboxypeptidase